MGVAPLVLWVLVASVLFLIPLAPHPAEAAALFVSSNDTSQVLEYNGATGAFVQTFVQGGAQGGAQGGGLTTPTGLLFRPNGDLLVSSRATNQVLEYNGTTGGFVNTFAQGNGLSLPWGLLFGPHGHLFVSSSGSNQVLEYDGTGAFVKTFAQGFGLSNPTGLVFGGPNGDLFVSSSNQVLEYDGTGAFVKTFAQGFGLSRPTGLVFGANSDLFVASGSSSQVFEYNGTGALVQTFVQGGAQGGGLGHPTFITFGPDISVVPEPPTWSLFGLGLLGLAYARLRRRRLTDPGHAA